MSHTNNFSGSHRYPMDFPYNDVIWIILYDKLESSRAYFRCELPVSVIFQFYYNKIFELFSLMVIRSRRSQVWGLPCSGFHINDNFETLRLIRILTLKLMRICVIAKSVQIRYTKRDKKTWNQKKTLAKMDEWWDGSREQGFNEILDQISQICVRFVVLWHSEMVAIVAALMNVRPVGVLVVSVV